MKVLPIVLAATLLLSGCDRLPYPREMGDMELLRTMGVDREEHELLVTVSTGPQVRGLKGEQKPALTLSIRRPSLSSAAVALQGLSDGYVFFGYVDQLLLGEELAREGVTEVLDYFARDVELGLGAQLWVVRGDTAQVAVASGGDQGVEGRLTSLQVEGETGETAVSRTAGNVYSDLLELGASYAPALVCTGQDKSDLIDGGYAILKGDALVGFLEGEQARGLELLEGKPSADVLEVKVLGEQAVVRITEADTHCRFRSGGEGLSITCRVSAQLAEYSRQFTQEELEQIREQVRTREAARIQGALAQLRSWKADCIGLGPGASLLSPKQWSALKEDWPDDFARQEPELTVQVGLRR
ncbi:MAG: Ger(x)C family spore germination C-terminal domain-containing protein [Lawsonibacter sp.]|nr:Ger(x)C family spore germination C-terminal domain-containing protein [Lawsonibacter sp.]